MATKESYDRKLAGLYQELLRMGVLVEENLKLAKQLVEKKDEENYRSIRKREDEINGFEIALEDKFISLIATEHPVARDLRKIVASLKINSHLERMGDYAVHVAKSLRALDGRTLEPFAPGIGKMLDEGARMLDDALSAFMTDDGGKASEAAARDDILDAEHDSLVTRLYKEEHVGLTAKEFARLLFLGRYLERIGDLVTNICEWIVYTGECRHVELNE